MGTLIVTTLPSTLPPVVPTGAYVRYLGVGAPSAGRSTLLTRPYSNTVPPFHFTYQWEWYGRLMLVGPMPPIPSHQATIHEGVPPAVAASAMAAGERSAIFSLNVRFVPLSPADASRMSRAGWLALASGTTGNLASPAASDDQFPGGRPCVPLTESVVPLRVRDVMATLAGVGFGSRLPLAANRLGPVRNRITALMGLPMNSPGATSERSLFSL